MPKKPKCKICKQEFERKYTTTQRTCSPICAIKDGKAQEAKKVASEQKVARKATRAAKQALKTKSQWLSDAQINACNPYIRKRDENEPCISCGKYDHEIEDVYTGGKWDAGHYKSRGAYPELRFHPMNIHKQCKTCNGGSGKFAKKDKTVSKRYKINLINKIGVEMVDWLEGPQVIQHLQIEDIKEIKAYYKEQLKYLTRIGE